MVCFCGRREPGLGPAADSLFFASPKKSKQKKGDPQSATPSRCYGANLQRGVCGVRRGTRYALARCARTTTASQITKHARGGAHATPQAPRRRRSQQGVEHPQTTRAIAALGPSSRAQAPRAGTPGRAQRWPVWLLGATPLLVAPAARRGWRIRARDCLSAAGASSSETPPAPSTAGCGLLGSDTHFTAVRSTAPSGRAEGSVNWGSDPKNPSQTAGSPFLW